MCIWAKKNVFGTDGVKENGAHFVRSSPPVLAPVVRLTACKTKTSERTGSSGRHFITSHYISNAEC
jgi:hypothetical protein